MSPTQPIVSVFARARCFAAGVAFASAAATTPPSRAGPGASTTASTASAGTSTAPTGSRARRCEARTWRGIARRSRDGGRPGLRAADAQSCLTGRASGSVVVLGRLLELRPGVRVVTRDDGRVRAGGDAMQLAHGADGVD